MTAKKYLYPLMVNSPSLILIVALLAKLAIALPRLPDRIPLHFGWNGVPNNWGSPRELFIVIAPLGLIWAASVLISYLWAGSERENKSFNWLLPLLTLAVPYQTGIWFNYLEALIHYQTRFTMPWMSVLGLILAVVGITVILEWIRPFIPGDCSVRPQAEDYRSRIEDQLRRYGQDSRAIYWESQDPLVARITVIIVIMSLLISVLQNPYRLYLILIIIPVVAFYGGIRIWVTPDFVKVRLGFIGIPLRRIRRSEIVRAAVHEFSPLRDFGGWGIRIGRNGVVGIFLWGNIGVLIEERSGRKTLIGSDNPARLAAVISADAAAKPKSE